MKNHDNTCEVVRDGECSCSLSNQPGKDIVKVLNGRADLYAEIGDLNEVILAKDQIILDRDEEIKALLDYPWGRQWTYWFTAMIAGGAAVVGLIVGTWMFQ